jgi:hypothetical protein
MGKILGSFRGDSARSARISSRIAPLTGFAAATAAFFGLANANANVI